jgi:hypothetical protein
MPAVMRASAVAERAGVPAVAIGATGFEPMGRAIARSLGIGHVPIALYPGVILTDDTATFKHKVTESVVPAVLEALTSQDNVGSEPTGNGREKPEPAPTEIVLSGRLDEIEDYFTDHGWTDGLPVIPPTIERVKQFLRHTHRGEDETVGVLAPENREATVWNIAVNGVMAGCRPEYMPLLLAIVECLADPDFRVQDAGSTPGWEPMVVVSGPIAEQLNFNSGTGVMRVGRQANTSVGRFVRLYLRNIAGLRIPPGHTDQGAFGYTFNVAMAENETIIQDLGWQPYRKDLGYSLEQSVVSIQSVVTISAPIYSGGESAADHLKTLATLFGNAMGPWACTGIEHNAWHPMLALGPSIAAALVDGRVTKGDIREYLYQNVTISAGELERYAWQVGATSFNLADLVNEGKIDPLYATSTDPDRRVPMFVRPEWIGIVVAGNPNRNQSRAYVANHVQGAPVSRAIDMM